MKLIDMAREFRRAYECVDSPDNEQMQMDLIIEEMKEFEASAAFDTDAEAFKELCDVVYVCAQYAANQRWDLDEGLKRVHESNLTKLGSDGKPLRRADGKVMKGPNYKPPVLTDLV